MTDRRLPPMGDRGQSVSINYTLSLVIVTMLISGLFIAMSDYLETERERATRSELDVLGNRVAADISAADRLTRTANGDKAVVITTTIPRTVAGSEYEVSVSSSSAAGSSDFYDVTIELNASRVDVDRRVSLRSGTEVSGEFNGGTYEIVLTAGGDLEVRNAG